LISEQEIKDRVSEVAASITQDYAGKELVMVGVLKGAFMFMSDLCRQIDVPLTFDFMAVSSYGAGTKSCGVVRVLKDLEIDINGKDVIIVEDIIDSGLTLNYLYKSLRARKPASLEICALLKKPQRDRVNQEAKYLGFVIDDEFVVGYGLDYRQRFRNLPYIAAITVPAKPQKGNGKIVDSAAGAVRR
jgi:hypoxanthine phosphoribosyltransferase